MPNPTLSSDLKMSCLDFSTGHLLVLRLARALAFEFPNTRETCLNYSSSAILANELAEAETLISGVLHDVAILRSHLHPINRLPTELLAHIFDFLGSGAHVVPASHVCQRWRSIILSTPSLWSIIREDDDIQAAQCFMQRSKSMPLDVSTPVYMRQDGLKAFHSIVAPHASRIRRLHIVVYGDRVYDFYRSLSACGFKMPLLEHFSIHMIEYGFPDDSRDGGGGSLPPLHSLLNDSQSLTQLTFRGALPLQTDFSSAITSLTLADRVFDLDALLGCLAAAPHLDYLALLDSVPHTFECTPRSVVALSKLRELHWFQGRVFDNVLGTVKLFEHLLLPNLENTQFFLLLDPTKYSGFDLYDPSHRSITLFDSTTTTSKITELHLEATNYAPGKPAKNNIVFHGLHNHETRFSVRVHRTSLESLCPYSSFSDPADAIATLFLTSSVHVDLSNLTQLTLTSPLPYSWGRFFRTSWARFFRCLPTVKVLRLFVSTPEDIIGALLNADNTPSSPLLPNLQTLYIFRCCNTNNNNNNNNNNSGGGGGGINDSVGVEGNVLLRFLKHRSDFGIPIETIICPSSPVTAATTTTANGQSGERKGRGGCEGVEGFMTSTVHEAALLEQHLIN
ncbi:hypothetical protein B0F90DRAFT_1717600 [Multifurca ochricompacta]|uniref:F-box domain-containing protein n=1 Tax=Multifurca ochricompacta TaxID=376703 RepID=A0AAD4M595_9AGAM|nr:hypothetical protein B0F90DRAFT_1717600 [Multifurca ochricompacta]